MRQAINIQEVPSSPFFSQAIRAAGHIYVSGLVGVDVATGKPAGPNIQDQTRQALTNCETVLHAAGATLDDVVEVGVLLANPADFPGMNEEYAKWFADPRPARYAAKLGAEIPGILVSIRMTAVVATDSPGAS